MLVDRGADEGLAAQDPETAFALLVVPASFVGSLSSSELQPMVPRQHAIASASLERFMNPPRKPRYFKRRFPLRGRVDHRSEIASAKKAAVDEKHRRRDHAHRSSRPGPRAASVSI